MQATIRIHGYDSLEQIAVGGMAVVYKARKLSLKKTVAIKILLPHLTADHRFVTRFQQEAEAAARIQHENIVNILDYGQSGAQYYIVMEYYDGLTVEELLRRCTRVPVDIALAIVLNICFGLEAAHAEKLVHRDIKPGNIIFTRQGGIKIADFGLAKSVEKLTLLTMDGKVVGTPAYMSPEQTRGEPVGTSSDIFSLGVVAYELLASRRPFDGASYSEVVDRIQSFEPLDVSSLNPMVEPVFEQIVSRMLAKKPELRYARIQDVIADLQRAMDERGFGSDRRVLARFFEDPDAYAEESRQRILARFSDDQPAGEGGGGLKGLFRKFGGRALPESTDEGESAPAADAPPDPDAEYRVVLESINRDLETPESFALKLAMRMKTPVPRLRTLLSRIPCPVAQRLPGKKAKALATIIEELGGTVRLEVMRDSAPRAAAPPPQDTVAAPNPRVEVGTPQIESARPSRLKRAASGGIVCPRCGWEEDAGAKFCSLCLHSFHKTDKIDVRPVPPDERENPLEGARATRPHASAAGLPTLANMSPRLLIATAAALLLLPILLFVLLR